VTAPCMMRCAASRLHRYAAARCRVAACHAFGIERDELLLRPPAGPCLRPSPRSCSGGCNGEPVAYIVAGVLLELELEVVPGRSSRGPTAKH
jgi:hypothetical protein